MKFGKFKKQTNLFLIVIQILSVLVLTKRKLRNLFLLIICLFVKKQEQVTLRFMFKTIN